MRIFTLRIAAAGLCLFMAACSSAPKTVWDTTYKEIESNIVAPVFPDRTLTITDYGAVPDDLSVLNTGAINAAIAECSEAGGGRVVVPAGVWHTGPLTLLAGVDLHIAEDAVLLFTNDLSQYPIVITRWEGMDCYNYQPMIYAYRQDDIAITGKGTIDGGGTVDDWWAMCGAVKYGWHEGIVSQRIGRPQLGIWNETDTPVEERIMGDGYGMRPALVNLYECKGVLIEDVTMLRSPFWTIHPLLCENVTVRGVRLINDGPNGDGCNPESCKNVLIENCYFDTGDDCIAIKSGRNNDGRRWGVPSENIIVRGCRMKNGHGGVVIGSEISGGFRNLFVEDCEMDSPQLDRVICIKTSTCRGGLIENIYVRNVSVGQCKEAVLKINLLYEQNENCERGHEPTVRNVNLENVTCKESRYGVMIVGLDTGENVRDITLTDCTFDGVKEGNLISGQVAGVSSENLYINGELIKL